MNTIRLIALDLDGTLLDGNGEVSPLGYRVLKELRKQGMKILISSGRPFYSVRRIFRETVYDYVSCMNGLQLYDNQGKCLFAYAPLQKEEIQYCFSKLKHYPMILSFSEGNTFYHTCSSLYLPLGHLYAFVYKYYHVLTRKPYYPHTLTPSHSIHLETCEKLCFSSLPFILKAFSKTLDPTKYACFFVNSKWLEVCPAAVSKGNMLHHLTQSLHLSKDNICSIGDGENDLSLFEESGISVAMQNAMTRVKEKATDTTLSYHEDGAVLYLKKKFLS